MCHDLEDDDKGVLLYDIFIVGENAYVKVTCMYLIKASSRCMMMHTFLFLTIAHHNQTYFWCTGTYMEYTLETFKYDNREFRPFDNDSLLGGYILNR